MQFFVFAKLINHEFSVQSTHNHAGTAHQSLNGHAYMNIMHNIYVYSVININNHIQ